jgi:hypothetical protein
MSESVFKMSRFPAAAFVFGGLRPFSEPHERVYANHHGQAAGLAEAHLVKRGKPAVVAGGKLPCQKDVAPGVRVVVAPQRVFRKEKQYVYALVDYVAQLPALIAYHDSIMLLVNKKNWLALRLARRSGPDEICSGNPLSDARLGFQHRALARCLMHFALGKMHIRSNS